MAEVYFEKAKQVVNSLVIQCNGTQKLSWNGSAAATLNITPSVIGAAAASHTHNYAGSSSAGGAANSAVKLTTARTINGVSFNGTSNINLSAMYAESLNDKTISLNDLNLENGGPWIKYYYCGSDGSGANITGRPDDNNKRAFYLKVELIRYISTTDYICKQTYVSGYNVSTYIRYCTNGNWDRWMLETKLLYGKSLPSSSNKEGDIFLLYS